MVILKFIILATVFFLPALLYCKASSAFFMNRIRTGQKAGFCPALRKFFLFFLLVFLFAIQYIDFIASNEAAGLARQYFCSAPSLYDAYSDFVSDKTASLLSFIISSFCLSYKFADRVLLDLSSNLMMSTILLVLAFVLALVSFQFVLLSETVFVIVLASSLYGFEDDFSNRQDVVFG